MNWDASLEEFCEQQNCSEHQIMRANGNPVSRREAVVMQKRQKEAKTAMNAVRRAIEEDPTRSREDARKRACSFIITGSLILSLFVQALLSTFMKRAIEWFLDKYYNKETPNGALSISAE